MKSLFALVILCGAVSSFAASANLRCFKADQYVHGLPKEICLNSVESQRNGTNSWVLRMTGEKIDISTEDYYMEEPDMHLMAAKFKFVEFYETCGDSLRSTLEARFRMSGSSVVNFAAMSIEVPYEATNDSCHSGWSRGVVKYSYYAK